MSLSLKKVFVFAALELTYGTAVALTGANAVQTHGAKVMPLEGSVISRDLDRTQLGGDQKIHVGVHQKITFDVEYAASGVAGTAPKWGKLMRACGFSEIIVVGTSVEYVLASASTDSLTMYFQLDGQRHAMLGCRGNVKFMLDSQKIPYLQFEFTGLRVVSASATDLVPDLTGWFVPLPVTFANTATITYDGYSAVFSKLMADVKNDVQHFNNPGEESVQIVNRDPEGSFNILAPALSTKNYFEFAVANTLAPITVVHGTVAGNILTLASPAAQLLQPKYSDDRLRAVLDGNLSFPGGDEALSLLCT